MKLPPYVGKRPWTVLILTLSLCPIQVRADITVTQRGKHGGVAPNEVWTRKLRIKGLKMRVETLSGKESRVSIYDLETGKRIRLNPQRKEAFVLDLAPLSEHLRGSIIPTKLVRAIRPTGKKIEIVGTSCYEYAFDLQAPTSPWRGMSAILHDTGTVCVSQNIPGGVEFTNFVHEAKKRRYTAAASECSPTESQIGFYFYGEEPDVMVLSAKTESAFESGPIFGLHGMTSVENVMSVTEINSNAIADEEFQVPADWKIKKDSM
jgi:hypothetical protein